MSRIILSAAAACLFSACAIAQDATSASDAAPTTNAERIVPEGWEGAYNGFHYAPAVIAGDTIYLSGVVAGLAGDEDETNPADLEASFDRAFEALGGILEASGADWSHVVEMTTFHTELMPQIQPFSASKDKYMKEPYPAWTAIDVDRLYVERGIVEIKLIAYVGD